MKLHLGGLVFDVKTVPGLQAESFAIVSDSEAAVWKDGYITMISRDEYDRRYACPSGSGS